jgi:hypothetical protein
MSWGAEISIAQEIGAELFDRLKIEGGAAAEFEPLSRAT